MPFAQSGISGARTAFFQPVRRSIHFFAVPLRRGTFLFRAEKAADKVWAWCRSDGIADQFGGFPFIRVFHRLRGSDWRQSAPVFPCDTPIHRRGPNVRIASLFREGGAIMTKS